MSKKPLLDNSSDDSESELIVDKNSASFKDKKNEKISLLDGSSDSEVELTVNKNYASRYDQWRNKEELQKYKDLKKDEEDSESSSESEAEIPEFDEEFLRALSLLKGKDPRIYDKNFHLFQNKEIVKKPKTEKQKPMYMKDYERNLVLERGGKFSDEDEDNLPESVPTYDEEQEKLKKSFKEAVGGSDNSDVEDLLQVRTKTKKEEEEEEADYIKWLKGEEKEISEDLKNDMSYLRNYWNDPKIDEGEKFLRDYILNKRYLEKDDTEIPSYEELTSGKLSDDEKMLEEQEKFEHKYNFRFEEPDEEFIKRYPRTVGDSLRRVDTRRKQKREEKAERKRKEKEQRREELKRLKALKRKEIEEKFMKLKEISGQDEINFNESDMESDFDPDKHDQKMREMFNDDYYQIEEDQKPEFPYDEELDSENWNAWTGEKIVDDDDDEKNENEAEEEEESESNQNKSNTNPKEDFANEMINASRPKKKVKKKSLFAKIISQPKPVYDPDGKSFQEYLDEYYKLDYEDIVGDMPVRYKYRQVIPNDFGLTVDEILAADDRELNRWCSVKKTCQYRNDDEELYDVQAFCKKAQNPMIKKKILPSVYAPKDEDDFSIVDRENSKRKKKYDDESNFGSYLKEADDQGEKKVQCSADESVRQAVDKNQESTPEVNAQKKKSKKKKKKKNPNSNFDSSVREVDNQREKKVLSDADENIGQAVDENQISTTEVKRQKNKRMKKRICNSLVTGCETQNDVDVNESNAELSDLMACSEGEEKNLVQSCKERKKSKKKKQTEMLSGIESKKLNFINERINEGEIDNISSNSKDSSCKSVKRKREHSEEPLLVNPDSKVIDASDSSDNISPKSKHKHMYDTNDACNLNFITENTSEEPAKKKRKKKKKQNKHIKNDSSNNVTDTVEDKSKVSHNIFKDKQKMFASKDKRLGLSDERLAAYGINPKKFKNRIIYSKK